MKDKLKLTRPLYKNPFIKDFSWYVLGSFFPIILGFIKTPVFTRHFSARDFGELGLVSIGFNLLGVLFFSWIGSCIWRYFAKYKSQGKLGSFYSNLLFLSLISMLGLALLTAILYNLSVGELQRTLILFSFFQVVLNQTIVFYMILMRLESRSRDYTTVQATRALLSLSVSLLLVFYFKMDISALIAALVITDLIFCAYLGLKNPLEISFKLRLIKKELLTPMVRYGSMGLILNFCLLAITYSDRYVIALFYDLNAVGIYDQVYKISQLSIMALVTIYFNTINPYLLNKLETEYESTIPLIRKYLFGYLFVGLPLVFYLSLYSKEISILLLGSEFRSAYTMMPIVFFATFLHGITNFYELRLKFNNQLKKLSLMAIGTTVLNIVLNLILIPWFGYQWAAYNTAITYAVMLLILHFWNPGIDRILSNHGKLWLGMGLLFISQLVVYLLLIQIFGDHLVGKILIGLIFVLVFIGIYYKKLIEIDLPVN